MNGKTEYAPRSFSKFGDIRTFTDDGGREFEDLRQVLVRGVNVVSGSICDGKEHGRVDVDAAGMADLVASCLGISTLCMDALRALRLVVMVMSGEGKASESETETDADVLSWLRANKAALIGLLGGKE